MNYIAILFGLVAVVFAVKQEVYNLPEDKVLKLQKVANACATEHNVDPGLFSKLSQGTLPRDAAIDKYTYCFAIKTGLIDEAGHIVVDKLAGLLENHPLVEEFRQAIRKCNEVTKENTIETVAESYRCYDETAPIRFSF